MNKKVLLIYQDCPDCGKREEWYKAQQEIAKLNHITIVPTPHNAAGVKDIILEAQAQGYKNTLLFYTDGKKCANDIQAFIPRSKKSRETEKLDAVDEQA